MFFVTGSGQLLSHLGLMLSTEVTPYAVFLIFNFIEFTDCLCDLLIDIANHSLTGLYCWQCNASCDHIYISSAC